MTKQVRHDMKRMLNQRLSSFERDHPILQTFSHRFDLSAFGRYLPFDRMARHLVAFIYTQVARVAEHAFFMPVEKRVSLRYIRHVRCRAHQLCTSPQ